MASEAKRAGPQGPPGPPPHPPPSSSTSVKSDQRDPPPARELKNNKIFVGGISWTTTDEAFSRFFTKYGDIIDAIIMRDKMTRQSRGFGFVTFKDPNTVTSVLEETLELDGRNLDCKLAVPKDEMQQSISSSSQKTRKIFVGGLPPDVTEDDFKKYFEYYGNVVEAKIMTDGMTGKPRGFGFITFDSEEVVDKISEKHHVEINGKTVECKKAIPKGRMDNDRGGHSYGQYNSYGRSSHGGGYGYGGRGGGYGYGGGYGDGGYGDGGYGDGGYGHHENGRGGPRNDYTSSYTSAYHDRGQQGQYGGYSGNYSGYGGNYQGYGSQRSGGYQGDYGGSNGYGGGYGRNSGGYGRGGGGGGGGGGGRYDRSYHPYS